MQVLYPSFLAYIVSYTYSLKRCRTSISKMVLRWCCPKCQGLYFLGGTIFKYQASWLNRQKTTTIRKRKKKHIEEQCTFHGQNDTKRQPRFKRGLAAERSRCCKAPNSMVHDVKWRPLFGGSHWLKTLGTSRKNGPEMILWSLKVLPVPKNGEVGRINRWPTYLARC